MMMMMMMFVTIMSKHIDKQSTQKPDFVHYLLFQQPVATCRVYVELAKSFIMPPSLIGGGIKRCFCLTFVVCLSVVCLSRTSGLGRQHRGLGRTKLAQR